MFQFGRVRSSSISAVSLICRNLPCNPSLPVLRTISNSPNGVSFLLRTTTSSTATTANASRRVCQQHQKQQLLGVKKCKFSSTTSSSSPSPSWLEGDIGKLGTTIYHSLNVGLAVVAPIYFLTPERYANGYINKTVGFLMATGISLHTYIGLNYVCRDYVPKISYKLLGPARIVTAAFTFIMFVGMSKIALYSPNGIKGVITGLWTSPKTKNDAATEA